MADKPAVCDFDNKPATHIHGGEMYFCCDHWGWFQVYLSYGRSFQEAWEMLNGETNSDG